MKSIPLSLKGGFAFGRWREHKIMFDKLTLQADNIPVELNGQVVVEADSVVSDLVCKVSPLQFQRVLSLVPEAMMPTARHFQTNLTADLETRVTGTYRFDNNVLPTFRLAISVMKDRKCGLTICNLMHRCFTIHNVLIRRG